MGAEKRIHIIHSFGYRYEGSNGFGTCVAVFRGTIGPTVKHGLVVHKINWLDVYLTVRSIVSFCANRYSHNLETYITLRNGKRNSKLTMFTLTMYVLFRF